MAKRVCVYGLIALIACIVVNAPTQPASATDTDQAAREFQARLAACPADDQIQQLQLASWAVAQGLLAEADQVYRDVLDLDPNNEQARASLAQIASNRKLPRESNVLEAATDLLPASFASCESAHFVVVSDAGLIRARKHAELLERAMHQFKRMAARLDLRPLPLQHKLVCVLFRSIDDYREFASAHDGVDAVWVTGYYAPANDRMVFYDAELVPPPPQVSVMLDQASTNIAVLEHKARDFERSMQASQAQIVRKQVQDLRQQREQAKGQLDVTARAAAIATAVHEAVHQLLYHTRVQSLHVRSPLWISEGLATNFETDTPNQAFGPDHEHQPRRSDFDQYLAQGRLLPLAELVQIDELSAGDEQRAAVLYAQSYALVRWMCRFKIAQLRKYLDLMRIEVGEPSPQRHLELFEAGFGPASQLERAWLKHERDRAARQTTVSALP